MPQASMGGHFGAVWRHPLVGMTSRVHAWAVDELPVGRGVLMMRVKWKQNKKNN